LNEVFDSSSNGKVMLVMSTFQYQGLLPIAAINIAPHKSDMVLNCCA
jgi:hypothetical protein